MKLSRFLSRILLRGTFSLAAALVILPPALLPTAASADEICIYKDGNGKVQQVMSAKAVPEEFRKSAQCFPQKSRGESPMAAPKEIHLEGSLRTEDMNSSIGRIHLRWERKAERLFGRTPVRAMSDAARTVAQTIKGSGFPSRIQNLSMEWEVVFLGDKIPAGQVPSSLVNNCHPGWMTPPANIYIVADRVAGGCGSVRSSTSVADSTLTEVLLHEMGHVIEFQIIDGAGSNTARRKFRGDFDRMRAEGWATFFESYAARNSSVINAKEHEQRQTELARQAVASSPEYFNFGGSSHDYARASMYFVTMEKRLGMRSILEVYDTMGEKGISFFDAIKEETGWDQKRREKEIRSFLKLP